MTGVVRAGHGEHRRGDLGQAGRGRRSRPAPRRPARSPGRRRPASACSSAGAGVGSRSRKPGANQRSAEPRPSTGVPDDADLARPAPATRRASPILRAGARAVAARDPARDGRAAAAGRRRRRPSRRRRRTGRPARRAAPGPRRRASRTPAASSAIVNGSSGTAWLRPWPGRSQPTTSNASASCRGARRSTGPRRRAERRAEHQQRPRRVRRRRASADHRTSGDGGRSRRGSWSRSSRARGAGRSTPRSAAEVVRPVGAGARESACRGGIGDASAARRAGRALLPRPWRPIRPVSTRRPASSSVVCDAATTRAPAESVQRRPLGVPAAVGPLVDGGRRQRGAAAPPAPGAASAARRISTDSTGLAFCGIVDEPPRRRPRARRARRSRVAPAVRTSLAMWPLRVGAARTSASAMPGDGARLVCHGGAAVRPRARAGRLRPRGTCAASGVAGELGERRRACPQHRRAAPASRSDAQVVTRVEHALQPPRRLEPEGDRDGVLGQRPAGHQRRRGGRRRARRAQPTCAVELGPRPARGVAGSTAPARCRARPGWSARGAAIGRLRAAGPPPARGASLCVQKYRDASSKVTWIDDVDRLVVAYQPRSTC